MNERSGHGPHDNYEKPNYQTKIVRLPGGKILEIIYHPTANPDKPTFALEVTKDYDARPELDDVKWPLTHFTDAGNECYTEPLPLIKCEKCGLDMVEPINREDLDDDMYRIERECKNCGWRDVGEFYTEEVEEYVNNLFDIRDKIIVNARNLSRITMEDDVAALVEGINSGNILPEDIANSKAPSRQSKIDAIGEDRAREAEQGF